MDDLGTLLLCLLAIPLFLVFPIWAAYYAGRRGRSGWALLSFLSTL